MWKATNTQEDRSFSVAGKRLLPNSSIQLSEEQAKTPRVQRLVKARFIKLEPVGKEDPVITTVEPEKPRKPDKPKKKDS